MPQTMRIDQLGKKKEEEAPEVEETAPREVLTESFTEETLQKYWQEYAEKADEEGKMNVVVMMRKRELMLDGHTIHIRLDNDVQYQILKGMKEDLMKFLREKLRNTEIMLEAEIAEAPEEDRIYTDREKFQFLAKKFPALQQLRDKFGLDTDY